MRTRATCRSEPTLERAGACARGQTACSGRGPCRAVPRDASPARRDDASSPMSKEVAISGAEACRRVPRHRRRWSLLVIGAADRKSTRDLIQACYDATPDTLPSRRLANPRAEARLVSACATGRPADLHQQDEGRLRPMSTAWGHGPDGGDEFCTGSELPWPTHRALLDAADPAFFASATSLGEGVSA